MVLKIHNSLTKKLEDFKPLREDYVSLYTCGPTVYDYAHIGNFRAYIFGDILKRTLLYNGFNVKHVMNITDIDDKTIRDSQKNNQTFIEFTQFYTELFFKDRDTLNILHANKYTKATDYVKEMLEITQTLIDKGFAYIETDGSVYFSINKNPAYGKLVTLSKDTLKENASGRIKKDEYDKENAQDFALWKAWDSEDGEVKWDPKEYLGSGTKIALGRPGWHIECSAMSMATLGETIDIHTGGLDNMFPHHENEIAQSECATGKDFVKYWMHNGWLLVDGKKMAKSAGNFYRLKDLVDKGYDPLAYRYLTLQTHYRSPLNFTFESLESSKTALEKIKSFIQRTEGIGSLDEHYAHSFTEAINDDLNVSKALGIMWTLLSDKEVSDEDKKATILNFDKVFGLGLESIGALEIPQNVQDLLKERDLARSNKDWAKSDLLRIDLENLGFNVLDTNSGTKLTKKS